MMIRVFFIVLSFPFLLFSQEEIPDENSEEKMATAKQFNELLKAAEYGNFIGVRKAIDNKLLDFNRKDRRGMTPLHAAAVNGHSEIVKMLIREKANVNTFDKKKISPLMGCIERGHYDVARVLLENGADPNVKNKDGQTPLHVAAANGHLDTVKILVEKGAALNARDEEWNPPVLRAVSEGHLETVAFLVRNGADINQKNRSGHSPIQLATQNGLGDLTEYISKNKDQFSTKKEVGIGEVSSFEEGTAVVKLSTKEKISENYVIYFVNEKNEEMGRGKISFITSKMIKVKLESGITFKGDKALYYK